MRSERRYAEAKDGMEDKSTLGTRKVPAFIPFTRTFDCTVLAFAVPHGTARCEALQPSEHSQKMIDWLATCSSDSVTTGNLAAELQKQRSLADAWQ